MDIIKQVGGFTHIECFAGGGGGILAGEILRWQTICAVEFAKYPTAILLQRQNDGQLEQRPGGKKAKK